MKKVRWGLIGAGRIAQQFASDIQYTNNAELRAIASRSEHSAKSFAQQYSIDKAYGAYAELYQDPDIDAVYVATPHNFHKDQTIDIINSGKSVLCEKPFTISPQECQAIINAAKESSVSVMEALWTYFLPAIQKAKAWYEEGRIGKLVQIHSSFGYPIAYDSESREYNAKLAGGCLLDMGIYPIAINYLFTQSLPKNISATASFAPNGVEDDVVMLFEYPSITSSLSTSFRSRLPNWTYVVGEEGYIAIPDSFRASECNLYQLDELIDSFVDNRRGGGFEFQIEAFSQSILLAEKESRIMPLQTSLALQEIMSVVKEEIQIGVC